jgi:hypothetical protein
MIRHVGFAPLYDTIEVVAATRLDREFILMAQPQRLDSVRVEAAERKYISLGLREFEERRKAGAALPAFASMRVVGCMSVRAGSVGADPPF